MSAFDRYLTPGEQRTLLAAIRQYKGFEAERDGRRRLMTVSHNPLSKP